MAWRFNAYSRRLGSPSRWREMHRDDLGVRAGNVRWSCRTQGDPLGALDGPGRARAGRGENEDYDAPRHGALITTPASAGPRPRSPSRRRRSASPTRSPRLGRQVEDREAGDELLRLRERPVDHGALAALEADARALLVLARPPVAWSTPAFVISSMSAPIFAMSWDPAARRSPRARPSCASTGSEAARSPASAPCRGPTARRPDP